MGKHDRPPRPPQILKTFGGARALGFQSTLLASSIIGGIGRLIALFIKNPKVPAMLAFSLWPVLVVEHP